MLQRSACCCCAGSHVLQSPPASSGRGILQEEHNPAHMADNKPGPRTRSQARRSQLGSGAVKAAGDSAGCAGRASRRPPKTAFSTTELQEQVGFFMKLRVISCASCQCTLCMLRRPMVGHLRPLSVWAKARLNPSGDNWVVRPCVHRMSMTRLCCVAAGCPEDPRPGQQHMQPGLRRPRCPQPSAAAAGATGGSCCCWPAASNRPARPQAAGAADAALRWGWRHAAAGQAAAAAGTAAAAGRGSHSKAEHHDAGAQMLRCCA